MHFQRVVDLTHTLSKESPTWSGSCGFSFTNQSKVTDKSRTNFTIQAFGMHAGVGTHMDAPAHCFTGARTIESIHVGELLSPCSVINISERVSEGSTLSLSDVVNWEKEHGRIKNGDFIFIRTGWDKFFFDKLHYRNNLRFPSIDEEAAGFLNERGVVGIGIDTLSPDLPDSGFPVHRIFLGAGKYIVENAANLHQLPPHGATVLALPLKIDGATESPIRLIAFI